MPKLKQPKTLGELSIEALGKRVTLKAREAIGSGRQINTSGLNEYLYAELPRVLWENVTTGMLSEVAGSLAKEDFRKKNVNRVTESIVLAIACHDISCLDLLPLPKLAVKILCCHIQTFEKLRTLIFDNADYLSDDDIETPPPFGLSFLESLSYYMPAFKKLRRLFYDDPTVAIEKLPIGLSSLKLLVNFQMHDGCTDAIINTLASCCFETIEHIHINFCGEVTDACFNILIRCHKLKHFSICNTSVTAEGYVQYLKSIQQHKSDSTGFLHVGVGSLHDWANLSWKGWEVSTRQLIEIAVSCPELKELTICNLRGNFEALVSLTTLKALQIQDCDFRMCNIEGFLRLRGSNLISLKLCHSEYIDLRCILRHCINIKRLFVWGGFIMDMALGNIEDAGDALQSLEDLDLNCHFSALSMERMLYACVNVERLNVNLHAENITDEFIQRLLYNNPLQKLTSFSAFSIALTMNSVNAIIDHCPLLSHIGLMHFTDNNNSITDLEIMNLRQRIAENNQDLEIILGT